MKDIKTFIFFDTETTGLPHEENNQTKITELCFIAIQSRHLAMGVSPRIRNKINLCFYTDRLIAPEARTITGLSNELLKDQPSFNEDAWSLLKDFINLQPKPVCFVAHNGYRFDYPILKAEVDKAGGVLSDDLLCVDSLLAFRMLHDINEATCNAASTRVNPLDLEDEFNNVNEIEVLSQGTNENVGEIVIIDGTPPIENIICSTNSSLKKNKKAVKRRIKKKVPVKQRRRYLSFTLTEVYKRLTSKQPKNAHQAECDVEMMIECAVVLGPKFIKWCDLNAINLSRIPKMESWSIPKMVSKDENHGIPKMLSKDEKSGIPHIMVSKDDNWGNPKMVSKDENHGIPKMLSKDENSGILKMVSKDYNWGIPKMASKDNRQWDYSNFF